MILENNEEQYLLSELCKLVDGGRDKKTLWHWTRGREKAKRVHMEYIQTTSGMKSSVEAYSRFIFQLQKEKK